MKRNCLRAYYKFFATVSAFILLVLIRTDSTDTANTAALTAETEAAPGQAAVYRRRSRRVQEVCHRHGLAGGQPANSSDTGALTLEYQRAQSTYSSTVSDKVSVSAAAAEVTHTLLQYSIMVLDQYSLVYCWIHKAASSSWNRIFFDKIGRKVSDSNLHTAAAVFRPGPGVDLAALFSRAKVSFTFVRHPFERLVSAFRDKFEIGKKTDWCYKMYAADVLGVAGSELYRVKDTAYMNAMYAVLKDMKRPSFPEFVAYLLRTPVLDYNDHWLPYWLHCQLCSNRFNVIGTFETIKEDVEYIIEATNLDVDISRFPWTNKKGQDTEEPISFKYFKQIDAKSVQKLFNIYKIDFEMFGYSAVEYLTGR